MAHWNNLEHKVWKTLKDCGLQNESSYALALSGGLDSMALYEVMKTIRPRAFFRVLHFHHGSTPTDLQQMQFRDQAFDLMKHKISEDIQNGFAVELVTEISQKTLTSENEMREARWNFFRRSVQNQEPILTGHHQDDWLETTLLKMLRGTSVQGVTAFQIWNGQILRPFLEVSRDELFHYVTEKNLKFFDDPSNQEDVYLRNWVRNDWLRSLEEKNPGGVYHLAQSLRSMVVELKRPEHDLQLQYQGGDIKCGLSRSWYLSLSQSDQLSALAGYLKAHQIRHFTRGQLEEIKKRLDKNQKDLTFTILDRKWVINATQIMLE